MDKTKRKLNLLFIFTAVGLTQDPGTAGVRKAMLNVYKALKKRGHKITLLAPAGSVCPASDIEIIPIQGSLQDYLHDEKEIPFYPIYKNSFLGNALKFGKERESEFDFIINFSNDWLPYYMTPFFKTPLIHRMNLSNENEVVTDIIQQTVRDFPNSVGVLTIAQAADVGIEKEAFLLGQGLDLDIFPFYNGIQKENHLAFIARISPEKGLEDAAEIAARTNHKLLVFGHIQNQAYYDEIINKYADTIIYKGHLEHKELTQELATCKSLVCTHKWVEAFAGVMIQAMACGLPVIAYDRGGPSEIIKQRKTGFLAPPDDISTAANFVSSLDSISAIDCRKFVEANYSLEKLANRYENWFEKVGG